MPEESKAARAKKKAQPAGRRGVTSFRSRADFVRAVREECLQRLRKRHPSLSFDGPGLKNTFVPQPAIASGLRRAHNALLELRAALADLRVSHPWLATTFRWEPHIEPASYAAILDFYGNQPSSERAKFMRLFGVSAEQLREANERDGQRTEQETLWIDWWGVRAPKTHELAALSILFGLRNFDAEPPDDTATVGMVIRHEAKALKEAQKRDLERAAN